MSASHEPEPPGHPYDPELPFLETLEREVQRNALRAAGSPRAPHSARAEAQGGHVSVTEVHVAGMRPRRGGGPPLSGLSRVTRRTLTLVALLCLIGASAFGASRILAKAPTDPAVVSQGPFVVVSSAHAGSDRSSLRLYRRDSDLCRALVVAEAEASRCAPPPGPRALAITSTVSPLHRYVFGVTGREVARVTVRVGDSTRTVPTHTPSDASARTAGLPQGVRWFLAVVKRPAHGADPTAHAWGLDARHRQLGSVHVSCVETTEPQPCR